MKNRVLFIQPRADWLTKVTQLFGLGQVKLLVKTVLPLNQAAEAHKLSQSGLRVA